MNKCCAEIFFIFTYVGVFCIFILGILYQVLYGNIYVILVEAGMGLVADQVKSIVTQTIVYWVIIRRLGKFGLSAEMKNGKWDDEAIFHASD